MFQCIASGRILASVSLLVSYMARISGIFVWPWFCFRLSLPLFLSGCPESFQACGLLWGGAVASRGLFSGIPTALVLIRRHACVLAQAATCNRDWESHRL